MEEVADHASVNTSSFGTLDMEPEKLCEDEFTTLMRQVAIRKNIKMSLRN